MKIVEKLKLNSTLFFCIIISYSPAKSQTMNKMCEPVKVIKSGYSTNDNGEVLGISGTNMSQYEITLEKCPSSKSNWSTRTYYLYADSLVFDKHKYRCVIFLNDGKEFETVRSAKRSECR